MTSTKISSTLFILGAPDPEMELIEKLARDAGAMIGHASVDGVRVHPGNAYRADGFIPAGPVESFGRIDRVVTVECGAATGRWFPATDEPEAEVIAVDHHRPGDPGYGRPPECYWEASSVGQVAELIWSEDWVEDRPDRYGIPQDLKLVAAADHCLAHAYAGRCPGVDPEALMRWRAESRAAFQRRTVSEVLTDIDAARTALRASPKVVLWQMTEVPAEWEDDYVLPHNLPEVTVRDMRGRHVPELPEASAREGIAFLADGLPDRDGRMKVVVQSAPPETVRAFLEHWAPATGLVDTYGDPARGFAGGYLP